jgi:hypothetical protein
MASAELPRNLYQVILMSQWLREWIVELKIWKGGYLNSWCKWYEHLRTEEIF